MRVFLLAALAVLLFGCNSSSTKDPNKATDDTARMDNKQDDKSAEVTLPVKISASDIPTEIKVKGKVKEVWKWNDGLGENILIATQMAPYDDGINEYEEESQSATLHAFHYAKKSGSFEQVWMMNDGEKKCGYDVTCEFIKGATTITDLDKDGMAEIKVQYSLACRSDVSPAQMKLIMYENGDKYALRGVRWIRADPSDRFTVTEEDVNLEKLPRKKDQFEQEMMRIGRYDTEKEFANAPPEFLTYARAEWFKYVKEKVGEEE